MYGITSKVTQKKIKKGRKSLVFHIFKVLLQRQI